MSVRESSSSPRTCSGDIYAAVPIALPGMVSNSAAATVAALEPVSVWLQFRQSEVKDFALAVLGSENVAGFQVAMDYAPPMRGIQGVRNFSRIPQRHFER